MPNRSGIHAPNLPLAQFRSEPNGAVECPAAFWRRVLRGKFGWVKLLWPDHTRCDAEMARALGLNVIVRAPGEGEPHFEDVAAMIVELAGVCDVIEVGNEPPAAQLWDTAWFLEATATRCRDLAHQHNIRLIPAAWRGLDDPPDRWDQATADRKHLADRLREVYQMYDGLAVHCYDGEHLDSGAVKDHLRFWHEWIPTRPGAGGQPLEMPVYITEYGIAGRVLPGATSELGSNLLKAARYAAFINGLPGYVQAACAFIMNGTADFAAFDVAGQGYNPAGHNSYWLDEGAWRAFGTLVKGLTI